MAIIEVTSENFETEVLNSEIPVLVDFWAVWCGPCKMLSPVVHQVAEENSGIKVCTVNVDEAPDLAQSFGISSIPTLMVFKNGAVSAQSVGVVPKARILSLLGI